MRCFRAIKAILDLFNSSYHFRVIRTIEEEVRTHDEMLREVISSTRELHESE
jgi:hypothetical protein